MLQIQNIKKTYITGDLVQTALDDVSLTFREHELVAILGPSGSGKSTLLNVIGGLDHYDSGDLIINGISTKKYTDRDWDSYRNHSVGFIFQSYNLIPHQNVLSNVELALTISGVPASERKRRAVAALQNVGLGTQLHKKPNQMSGGQMQRVAIARALVNNPKILLADEPTGALDSETSIQVMELLKDVAKDRLVIMVTHNPELAEKYASRIVRVKDGRILDDSDPFHPDTSAQEPPAHKNMGHSSMSFRSALVLSFQNLWTKKARTLLTSFAGSIGIIGIALILSLSSGFQEYIDNIQRDTLASYPLTLQSETADMSSVFMSAMMPGGDAQGAGPETVTESPVLSKMFAHIGVNDLGSFKDYVEEHSDTVQEMVNSIQYGYGIKPRIYTDDPENPFQVNPASLFLRITGNQAFSAMMDSDVFQELSDDREMMNSQYDMLAGRWPESFDELVFILPKGRMLPDSVAYTLGLKDIEKLDHMLELMEDGKDLPVETPLVWDYSQLLDLQFRWVPSPQFYQYSEEFGLWEDLSEDTEFVSKAVEDGVPLHVVGIIAPKEGSSGIYYPGVGYLRSFTEHVIEDAAQSEIVQEQLSNPDVDVFSGSPFKGDDERGFPDLQSIISVDKNSITSAFGVQISEPELESLMTRIMEEAADAAANVDTTQAKQDFINTLLDFGQKMLMDYAENAGGSVYITLADAEPIATAFMNTEYAEGRLLDLSQTYSLPTAAFRQVYLPLLTSMINNFIAQDVQMQPDLPPLPVPPDVILSPAVPNADGSAVLPAGPETSDPADAPVSPDSSGSAPLPEAGPGSEPVPENFPTPELPQAPVTAEALSFSPGSFRSPVAVTLSDISYPEDFPGADLPAEEVTDGVLPENFLSLPKDAEDSQASGDAGTSAPENSSPEGSGPQDGGAADAIGAQLTTAKVPGIVYSFLADPSVLQAAEVMGARMMEQAAMDAMVNRIAGMDDELGGFIRSSFRIDSGRLENAFKLNMDEEKLRRLFEAMASGDQARSATKNLQKLGYADLEKPTYMGIYMKDFDGKEAFVQFLNDYNRQMEEQGQESRVVQYTDMTGQMMDSVRIIVNSVSYVLIAFVAVSLVVSSIMIGIITYISVMERTKEIGVLRAMGASKHNISQVFNAETFIIGLTSGVLGILISLGLLIPGNMILHRFTGNIQIAAKLPVVGAFILILLSMVLTVIGGLIPSKQAAKKDPVTALRSE